MQSRESKPRAQNPLKLHRFENGQVTLAEVRADLPAGAPPVAMHSRVGPIDEARLIYAAESLLAERLGSVGSATLWDVGMGTASNIVLTLDWLREWQPTHPTSRPANTLGRPALTIHSFETRPEGLALALEHLDEFGFLRPIENELQTLLALGSVDFTVGAIGVRWRLWVGDFKDTAPRAFADGGPAQRVFYDFYAPSESAEHWGYAAFRFLREFCDPVDCRMITYVAATAARSAMILAGFEIGRGPGHDSKLETTIAQLALGADPRLMPGALAYPLAPMWMDRLSRSSKPLPLDAPADAMERLRERCCGVGKGL